MIRFACPGCAAEYTVGAEKAGTAGDCPTCKAAFVIPGGGGGPAAAAAPAGAVEVNPCPKCGTRLAVAAGDMGKDVECPYCKAAFRADPPAPPPARAKPSVRRAEIDHDEGDDPPRSRRRFTDEDEDYDRPRRRRRRAYPQESKRVLAGVLALCLGAFGVHKFYLGYVGTGVLQLVLTLVTCGAFKVVAIVEGIVYLTRTDEEFIELYQRNEKPWF